jgi:adenylate kinase family enzyme
MENLKKQVSNQHPESVEITLLYTCGCFEWIERDSHVYDGCDKGTHDCNEHRPPDKSAIQRKYHELYKKEYEKLCEMYEEKRKNRTVVPKTKVVEQVVFEFYEE